MSDEELVCLAKQGDKIAEEYLINRYKGLARNKAKTYFILGADKEDVVQEGMIGIFKAIRDYDEKAGTTFSTFASLCVKRQIINAIKENDLSAVVLTSVDYFGRVIDLSKISALWICI